MKSLLLFLTLLASTATAQINQFTIFPRLDAERSYVVNTNALYNLTYTVVSSATLTRDTDSADQLDGVSSFVCDTSAQNGYCEFTLQAPSQGDRTGSCAASFYYKGDATKHKFQILNSSATLLKASPILLFSGDWRKENLRYKCSTAPRVRLVQTETGDGAPVNIGRVKYGSRDWELEPDVRRNQLINWNMEDSDITMGWTLGSVTPTVSTAAIEGDQSMLMTFSGVTGTLAAQVFTPMQDLAGTLMDAVVWVKTSLTNLQVCGMHGSSEILCRNVRGTNKWEEIMVTHYAPATPGAIGVLVKSTSTASGTAAIDAAYAGVTKGADFLPGWFVEGTITGTNPNLYSVTHSAYLEITGASLTFTPKTTSAPVGIMCSGTNAATAPSTSTTTCAAGDESIGINFDIPEPGTFELCVSFAHGMQFDSTGRIQSAFQISNTGTADQVIGANGLNHTYSGGSAGTVASLVDVIQEYPHTLCSLFAANSPGVRGYRLMYEQITSGAIDSNVLYTDNLATLGGRNIHWSVKPVTRRTVTAP